MRKSIVKNALKTKSAVIIAVIISVLFVSGCGKSSGVSNNDVLDTSEVSTQEETTVDTHPFDITMSLQVILTLRRVSRQLKNLIRITEILLNVYRQSL